MEKDTLSADTREEIKDWKNQSRNYHTKSSTNFLTAPDLLETFSCKC